MNSGPAVGTVVNTTTFCSTFPRIEGVEVARENLVYALEMMIAGKAPSVHVVGSPETGRSTLLAQFAKANHKRTVSVFAKRGSWFTYDPDFLIRDLCGQMFWLINGSELPMDQDVTDSLLRRLVYALKGYSARINTPIVLVVDGLDDIPPHQTSLRDVLISKLPTGFEHIRVLTSAPPELFPEPIRSKGKVWDIPSFSVDESTRFFGARLTGDQVRTIHETCRGLPGYLAGVARLLDSGKSADEILSDLPANLPALFEIEWRTVPVDDQLREMLALLAHDANEHNISDLSVLFSSDAPRVRLQLGKLPFLKLSADDTSPVEFASEAMRRYVGKELDDRREAVNRRIVTSLLADEESNSALMLLPSYLRQAGDHQKLLNYLSPERFARMLRESHRLGPVQQRVNLGLETALEIESLGDVLRFSIQGAVFSAYDGVAVSRSEIQARMKLDQYESAVALAQSAVLKADRLRLLAAIARIAKENNRTPEPELIASIRELFDDVDCSEFRTDALTELTTDLFYTCPDLATKVLEQGHVERRDRSKVDFALTELSLLSSAASDEKPDSHLAAIRTHITDPRLLSISAALGRLIRRGTAAEFLKQVDEIKDTKDRLFLLRQWAVHAKDRTDAGSILRYALNLGIQTTELTVNATHLRELATALHLVENREEVQALVGTIDTQKATIERLGPTIDYVHLQLLLCQAELVFDAEAAKNRLLDTYLAISELKDVAVKCACLARFIDLLDTVDPSGGIRKTESIDKLADQDFQTSLRELLASTADHDFVTRDVVAGLIRNQPSRAVEVALSLNTEFRRDSALIGLLGRLLDAPIDQINLAVIDNLLDRLSDPWKREKAVWMIVERLGYVSTVSKLAKHKELICRLAAGVSKYSDREFKVKVSAQLAAILIRLDRPELKRYVDFLCEQLKSAWRELDPAESKSQLAFFVAATMADADRATALEYLGLADELRIQYNAKTGDRNARLCILLAVRAYAGMLARGVASDEAIKELAVRVSMLPSYLDQVVIWTEVALKQLANAELKQAQDAVTQRIKPLIQQLTPDSLARFSAIVAAAPALYLATRVTGKELIDSLPHRLRDSAICQTIDFICRKHPSWEPLDVPPDNVYELTEEEIADIVSLLPELRVDQSLYTAIAILVRTLTSKYGKRTFTQQQRVQYAATLTDIVKRRLPRPEFISHDGYKILALAQIQRISRASRSDWAVLVDEGRKIPNTADRALVLAILARLGAQVDDASARELLDEAKAIADSVPSLLDRIGRYQVIAEEAKSVDKEFSKKLFREAMIASVPGDAPEYEERRQAIIDSAHRVSPELASDIASALDDDQARRAKRGVTSRVEMIELKQRLVDRDFEASLATRKRTLLPRASWELLGSLNTGRVLPCDIGRTYEFVKQAASMPFSLAYPVFSYVVENTVEKYRDKGEASRILGQIYSAVLTACDLFAALGQRAAVAPKPLVPVSEDPLSAGVTIGPHNAEEVFKYYAEWIGKQAQEQLWISDPYLTPDEVVTILRVILERSADLNVVVVTCRDTLQQEKIKQPYSEAFRNAWTAACLQTPPMTRVVIASIEPSGKAPIHDRWWISKTAGLVFGTSSNAVGGTRLSRVDPMSPALFNAAVSELSVIVGMSKRIQGASRISYESFDL